MGLLTDYLPDWLPADQQKADATRMGLLNFGAAMLANAQQGFGGALGQGLLAGTQGYQGARTDQRRTALGDMQLKTLGLENETKQLALDKQKRIADVFRTMQGPGASQMTPVTAPAQPLAPLDNPAFPRQPLAPWMQQTSLPAQPARQPAAPAMPTISDNQSRYMQIAQRFEQNGLFDQAQQYYDLAEKFKPKLKEQKVLRDQSGNVITANVFEDGRTEVVNGFAPADKLSFHNTGGETLGVDPYTGKPLARMKNSQSPDSVESNRLGWANHGLGTQRLAQDRQQANRLQHVTVGENAMTFDPSTGRYGTGIGADGVPVPKIEKPLTEAQAKDNLFGTRARESNKILTSLEQQGVTRPGATKAFFEQTGRLAGLGTDSLGGTLSDTLGSLTNWTQSPGQQQVEQARRDFINAVLRKESGAVISAGEFVNAEKQYFPQLNDTPQVLEQKRNNRQLAIQGILTGVPGGSRVGAVGAPASSPKPQSIKFLGFE